MKTALKKGFTFIEILLVVALIGIMLGSILIVINPPRQFANVRNSQRETDLRSILIATKVYVEENQGKLPEGIDTQFKNICRQECNTNSTQVNLQSIVQYMQEEFLPVDRLETNTQYTGYSIRVTRDGVLILQAPLAENGATISIGSSSTASQFDPMQYPGFSMWFSAGENVEIASGNRVISWTDKSDNAYQFVQTSPTSQPLLIRDGEAQFSALSFDGEDDFMEGLNYDINGLSQISLVLVTSSNAGADERNPADDSEHAYSPLFFPATGANGNVHLTPQRQQVTWHFGTGQSQSLPKFTRPTDLGGLYSVTALVKNQSIENLYIDGAQVAQVSGKNFPTANVSNQVQLGRENSNSASYFEGNIVEILVFRSALNQTQINALQGYFRGKYGVQ
jgi:prepilin-type N-terminal cleavage/methylation domain-containing protein